MKKWLRENNLEPGNGDPVHDLTQGDANYLLSVFAQALVASGIVSNIDTTLLEAKEREAEEKMEDDEEEEEDLSGQVDYLEHDLDLIDAVLVTNSDGSQELHAPESKVVPPSELKISTKPAMNMPAHLKPAMIDTSPREHESVEKTTEGILAMLHNLKNTPSPKFDDREKSAEDGGGTSKRVRKRKTDPDFQETVPGASTSKGKKKQRFSNLTVDKPISVNEGSTSPSSKALYALQMALDQQKKIPSSSSSSAPSIVMTDFKVPLTLLPHFEYLNEKAQKNLFQQLIHRFQSSSITPRNANINTPRWNHGGVLGLGVGIGINGPETPRFDEPINPDCFADHERSMFGFSPTAAGGGADGGVHPLDELIGDVDDKRTSKFKGVRLSSPSSAANGVKPSSPSLISSSTQPVPLSNEESAVEISVMIALQIITKSNIADKLLQLLISSDTTIPNFPPSTKSSNSLGIVVDEFPVPQAPTSSLSRSKDSPASKELDNLIAQAVSSGENLQMFSEGT